LTTDLQLVKNPASRVPASQATSSRIAGRHHLGISGRLRRNLQTLREALPMRKKRRLDVKLKLVKNAMKFLIITGFEN